MQRYLKQLFLCFLLACMVAQERTLMAVSLEENSPFIPFDYVGAEAPVAGPQKGGVELRGIFDFDGETRFSLYNPATQKSVWVKLKDKGAPYFVDSYDPEKTLITITVNGVRQQLPISKPKEDGGGPAVPRTPIKVPDFPPKSSVNAETESADEEDEEEEEDVEEEVDEDPEIKKRREMSEKVYEAFKKYVSEKKGQSS
jgi:hypothetical protein